MKIKHDRDQNDWDAHKNHPQYDPKTSLKVGVISMSCSDKLLNRDDGGSGFVAFDVVFELFTKFFYEAECGHGSCVAERAEGAAHHVVGEVLNVVDVLFAAATVVDAGEGFLDPVRAFAAGDAPTAGLVLIEGDG